MLIAVALLGAIVNFFSFTDAILFSVQFYREKKYEPSDITIAIFFYLHFHRLISNCQSPAEYKKTSLFIKIGGSS